MMTVAAADAATTRRRAARPGGPVTVGSKTQSRLPKYDCRDSHGKVTVRRPSVRELRLNFRYFRHVTVMVAEADATGSIACTQSDDLIITRSPVARGLAG
jgi:hypothetical protein